MTMREFIKANRAGIDEAINSLVTRPNRDGYKPQPKTFNDSERREWVLNDEGLYRWARAEGCRI